MILVTKPFLPPKEEVYQFLDGIWEREWLTNNGPLLQSLEAKLATYLGLPEMLFVTNGTIALQMAIKALELTGEVITTPFSFVATSSCIVWENCKPVYVDIDPLTFNINTDLIEAEITPQTSAILATHVFGNPCNIEAIEKIATKHGLKVIYDAAHCFGSTYKNKSVFAYGDISTTSFHATKLFHTIEGGGIFSNSTALLEKMSFLRNFGYNGPNTFTEVGINAKNSEFHAAMGLTNLKYIDEILVQREALCLHYLEKFANSRLRFQAPTPESKLNYSYMPVVFESDEITARVIDALAADQIFARKYFYPSLNTIPLFDTHQHCAVSESIASRVLCLPLYHTLRKTDVDFIANIILKNS